MITGLPMQGLQTFEELLAVLANGSTAEVYRALGALKVLNSDARAFEPLKRIVEEARTFKNQKLAYALLQERFPERVGTLTVRTDGNLGYIYFLQRAEGGHVKIGRTRNMQRRLRFFARKLPFKVEPIHVFRSYNYEAIERALHLEYARFRLHGEWFDLGDDVLNAIKAGKLPAAIESMVNL